MTTTSEAEGSRREFAEREFGRLTPLWVAGVLLRDRGRLLRAAVIGGVIGLVVGFLRPATFTTEFSFTPQVGDAADGAGLASLAGQFGVSLGGLGGTAQTPEFYADLLRTREILTPVASSEYHYVADEDTVVGTLVEFLEEDGATEAEALENTLEVLREKVVSAEVSGQGTGVVTVRVRTVSRQVSQLIAERLLEQVNHFNLRTAQRQAAAERAFLEDRLQEARNSLRAAEDRLQVFLQANRQVANSPELTFRLERLQRDVTMQQQLMLGLAQQYEEARIREVRDTPVLSVVERPVAAARADPRKRALILAASISVAVLATMAYALVRAGAEHLTLDGRDPGAPLLAAEWARLTRRR